MDVTYREVARMLQDLAVLFASRVPRNGRTRLAVGADGLPAKYGSGSTRLASRVGTRPRGCRAHACVAATWPCRGAMDDPVVVYFLDDCRRELREEDMFLGNACYALWSASASGRALQCCRRARQLLPCCTDWLSRPRLLLLRCMCVCVCMQSAQQKRNPRVSHASETSISLEHTCAVTAGVRHQPTQVREKAPDTSSPRVGHKKGRKYMGLLV